MREGRGGVQQQEERKWEEMRGGEESRLSHIFEPISKRQMRGTHARTHTHTFIICVYLFAWNAASLDSFADGHLVIV